VSPLSSKLNLQPLQNYKNGFSVCFVEGRHSRECEGGEETLFFISLDRGPCPLEQWMRTRTGHDDLISFKMMSTACAPFKLIYIGLPHCYRRQPMQE